MFPNDLGLDPLAEQRLQMRVGRDRCNASEFALGQVAQAWAEAEAERGAEGEDVIGSAAGVRVMRIDLQQRAVVQQAIKHVGRLVMGR
jgi:hypothetical protein